MFRITTVAREYGQGEGRGIVLFMNNKCLDISIATISAWHIGASREEFGTGFLIRLGRIWIDYTGGLNYE